MSDKLVRAISKDGFVKAAAVSTRELTERARQIHDASPVATAALGRLLAAGSMMGNDLKGDGASVTLRIKGDGPLGTLLVVSDNQGNVRGSVQNPQADLPVREDGKLDVGGGVGHTGTLTVIKDLNLKEPYVGSVELLENDLVQPEDRPRFLGRIHQEAQRLVSLINDILGLSQLDEGAAMPRESVSLLSLAQEAAASLSAAAQAQNVTLTVNGTAGTLTGVRRLLSETVRNLCENAVKYNVPGGSITVTVAETPRAVTLTVADTGIGIPPADQSRVFERFYRVDKSHSRAIGGTGLGLSIVKHAVAYHHGTVQLDSTPGQGTVITVTLPKDAA